MSLLSASSVRQRPLIYLSASQQSSETPTTSSEIVFSDVISSLSTRTTAGSLSDSLFSPSLIATANVFSTLKHTLLTLRSTVDALEHQTERMQLLAVNLKATEQINAFRVALEQKIAQQEAEMQGLQTRLESSLLNALVEDLKARTFSVIRDLVGDQVKQRVRRQLRSRLFEQLRKELQTQFKLPSPELDVSEDSPRVLQRRPPAKHPRLLLRPLPTPAQSPVHVLDYAVPLSVQPSPTNNPHLRVPAPTPVMSIPVRKGHNLTGFAPLTPSPLAQCNMNYFTIVTNDFVDTKGEKNSPYGGALQDSYELFIKPGPGHHVSTPVFHILPKSYHDASSEDEETSPRLIPYHPRHATRSRPRLHVIIPQTTF